MSFRDLIDYPEIWIALLMFASPIICIIIKMIMDYANENNISISELLADKFSPIIKFIEYIKSKRKLSVSEKLANEYPAVYEFVYDYGCRVTKFDTVIAIDERRKKWVCINDPNLYVWNFSDIDGAELVEDEKRVYVLIHTKRITVPEIRIESYDKASAERLLNTVNNMRKRPEPKPAVSAAAEIAKYKSLLDSGVITQEEYDKKKNELLNM